MSQTEGSRPDRTPPQTGSEPTGSPASSDPDMSVPGSIAELGAEPGAELGPDPAAGPANDDANSVFSRRRAMQIASATAGLLVVAKGSAFLFSGSIALLASLIDSLLDLLASLIGYLAVRHAMEPADADHRFGHGKAEALAGLGHGALILGSALFVALEAFGRIVDPVPVRNGTLVLVVLAAAAIISAALALYMWVVYRRTGSLPVGADAANYGTDATLSLGAMAAVWLAGLPGFGLVDPLFGLIIAVIIGLFAWSILLNAYDQLMDRELDEENRTRIKSIVLSHDRAMGIHDLRTRRSGTALFIQFHLELDPDMSLREAHGVADDVERLLLERFPGAQVLVHQEPVGEFIENDLVRT